MPGFLHWKPFKFWLGLLLGCCLVLGAGLARAIDPAQVDPALTTDLVLPRYQLGQQLYLESCGSCHVALPPAIMPTETWRRLLQDTQHYGQSIPQLVDPPRQIIWDYLQSYSRTGSQGARLPYRIAESQIFKGLHPEVQFAQPVKVGSCVACHPGADRFNFRSLSGPAQ